MASSIPTHHLGNGAELSEVIDQLFREGIFGEDLRHRVVEKTQVAANLLETWASYVLQLALPGADAANLEIEVVARKVSVKGVYRVPPIENASVISQGIAAGEFHEVFELPGEVDGDKAEAHFDRGILTVQLPKVAHLKPASVRVQMP